VNYFHLQLRRFIEVKNHAYTRLVRPSFGAMGSSCTIQSNMRCSKPNDIIFLGDRVFIGGECLDRLLSDL